MDEIDFPWYLDINSISDVWTITSGHGVVIDLIDSCVNFSIPALFGKNVSYSPCPENADNLKDIHGTAMAGLILADAIKLSLHDEPNKSTVIAGVAPDALIKNEALIISAKSLESTILKTSKGVNVHKTQEERQRLNIKLINISGKDVTDEQYWFDIVSAICKEDKSILISAAVGNNGANLTDDYVIKHKIFPALLKKPQICKTKGIDPITRVGAVKPYNNGETPKLYDTYSTGSNFGKNYVDILAPGGNIPILLPDNTARFAGGTSESTAIVTGAIALLIGCRPYSTAQEIRNVLLNNTDKFFDLELMVTDGRVLNINKAVNDFCIYKPSITMKENVQDSLQCSTPNESENIYVQKLYLLIKTFSFMTICNLIAYFLRTGINLNRIR